MKQQGHSKEIMNWGLEYLLKTYFDSEGSLWKYSQRMVDVFLRTTQFLSFTT